MAAVPSAEAASGARCRLRCCLVRTAAAAGYRVIADAFLKAADLP